MAKRLADMEVMMRCIPILPPLIKKSLSQSYDNLPFVDVIVLAEMSSKFTFPNMKPYDGTTDLDDRITSYKQRMFAIFFLLHLREACICKSFGSNLSGLALQWYTNLLYKTINLFAQLTDTFVE